MLFGSLSLSLPFRLIAGDRSDSVKRNWDLSAASSDSSFRLRELTNPKCSSVITQVCEMLRGCQWGHIFFSQSNGMFI